MLSCKLRLSFSFINPRIESFSQDLKKYVIHVLMYFQAFLTLVWIVEYMEVTGNELREEARQRPLATLDYMVSMLYPKATRTNLSEA